MVMKYVDAPSSAKTVPLNEKRNVGRPRTAMSAPENIVFHSLLEADEEEDEPGEEEEMRVDEMIAVELAHANETMLSLNSLSSKRLQPENDIVALLTEESIHRRPISTSVDFFDVVWPNMDLITPENSNSLPEDSTIIQVNSSVAQENMVVSNLIRIGQKRKAQDTNPTQSQSQVIYAKNEFYLCGKLRPILIP